MAMPSTIPKPHRSGKNSAGGQVTRKGKQLFLFLSGNSSTRRKSYTELTGIQANKKETGKWATYLQYGNQIELTIPASAYNDGTIHVLTLDFDIPIQPQLAETVQGMTLTARNATPHYSYSCFDYYSNYRSTTAYNWEVEQLLLKQLELIYTEQEAGKTLDLTIDNKQYTLTLDKGKPERPATNAKLAFASTLTWGQRVRMRNGKWHVRIACLPANRLTACACQRKDMGAYG